jgi:predicted RNA-binding protein with PUA-like domain
MKSEPDVFSIDDLRARPGGTERWDGVRNYQARNFLRDGMRVGDRAFFYHSSCTQPGIVGEMTIARDAYPDPTAADPSSPYYDSKHTADTPRWVAVDVKFETKYPAVLGLHELKRHPELREMPLLARGNRLSVMPVSAEQWQFIQGLVHGGPIQRRA